MQEDSTRCAATRRIGFRPAPPSEAQPPDAELATAFAVMIAAGNTATFIGPDNEATGQATVLDAAATGRPFFCRVVHEVMAFDGDAPRTDPEAASRTLASELRAVGLLPVVTASGRTGHRHVLARVPDPRMRAELKARADALGFDVRPTLRPPYAPHRLGGVSVVLEPSDPVEALAALAPTKAPPGRLRGRMLRLACEGDPQDRSQAAAAVATALVRLGWTEGAIADFLREPAHRAGAKLQAIGDPGLRERSIAQLVRSAAKRVAASPTWRTRPDIDAAVARFLHDLDREPARWRGRRGAALYVTARVCAAIALECGSLTIAPGSRNLGERIGADWRRAAGYCHAVADIGVLELGREGGGHWQHAWRLIVPVDPITRSQPESGHFSHSESGHFSLGGLWEKCPVSCATDFVAPDVFGPRGWFDTRGLGFEAWRALLLIEDAPMGLTADALAHALGVPQARLMTKLSGLLALRLVTAEGGVYRRGPSSLVDAARALRTLGTRTWKRAQHAAERRSHRRELAAGTSAAVARSTATGPRVERDLVATTVEIFGAEVQAA